MGTERDGDVVRGVEVVSLIRVKVLEGRGVAEDPVRLVTYIYEHSGELVARVEPGVW